MLTHKEADFSEAKGNGMEEDNSLSQWNSTTWNIMEKV